MTYDKILLLYTGFFWEKLNNQNMEGKHWNAGLEKGLT